MNMLIDERTVNLSEASIQTQSFYPKIRERSMKDLRKNRERSRKPRKPPALQAMVFAPQFFIPLVLRGLELSACGIYIFKTSRLEICFRKS